MTTEALKALQDHVTSKRDVIDAYLESARRQVELTQTLIRAALKDHIPTSPVSEGRVVVIAANKLRPLDLVEQIKALANRNILNISFDPHTLSVYVTIQYSPQP